ncbi:MAG: NifU N-terminal domain-containing protein [Gemmatimonadota bacterium]|nr:NifU N-terminal domain-containing protein [Gemmatimonadota bacterium]
MNGPDLTIDVQGTPNPNAAKFVLDRTVPGEGSRSYFNADAAAEDALAARLFAVEGVRALLLVDNFITVTKTEDADWDSLVRDVQQAIAAELTERSG